MYVAGAGPVGLATAISGRLLGAAVIVLGDPNPHRRSQASDAGFVTLDPTTGRLPTLLHSAIGRDSVDAGIDCVGFSGAAAAALSDVLGAVRPGGAVVLAGVYPAKPAVGIAPVPAGQAWAKALTVRGGVTPARQYVDRLLEPVRAETLPLARVLGAPAARSSSFPQPGSGR